MNGMRLTTCRKEQHDMAINVLVDYPVNKAIKVVRNGHVDSAVVASHIKRARKAIGIVVRFEDNTTLDFVNYDGGLR
jgi:ribosomal protein L14